MDTLSFEHLDVYRVALELDALVVEICRSAPRGYGGLCEQAQRASAASVLNLSEALGRRGADRSQRLRIARGEAMETRAALALFGNRRIGTAAQHERGAALAARLVQMLTRLGANG